MDQLIQDWSRERPELDTEGLGIANRISLAGKAFYQVDKLALKPLGLAPWACDVLLALRRQGEPYQLTPTDLRKGTLLTSGAMTARLNRLEERGLVQRTLDSYDRRSFQVNLTERGRVLADQALEARLEAVGRWLAPLTTAECEAAAGFLRRLLVDRGQRHGL